MKRSYSKEDMTAMMQLEKKSKKKYEKNQAPMMEKFWLHESWSLMLPLKILLPWDSPVFAPYPVHSLFKLESRLQDIQSSPKCAVAIQWIFSEISFTLKSNFFYFKIKFLCRKMYKWYCQSNFDKIQTFSHLFLYFPFDATKPKIPQLSVHKHIP